MPACLIDEILLADRTYWAYHSCIWKYHNVVDLWMLNTFQLTLHIKSYFVCVHILTILDPHGTRTKNPSIRKQEGTTRPMFRSNPCCECSKLTNNTLRFSYSRCCQFSVVLARFLYIPYRDVVWLTCFPKQVPVLSIFADMVWICCILFFYRLLKN